MIVVHNEQQVYKRKEHSETMNTKILKELGFNEKEITVYLTLLQAGTNTASKVAIETGIDRATCYRYLDALIAKGTTSYVIKNNVKYYTAANPEKILADIKEKEKSYKEILPELLKLSKLPKEETIAEVYKGKDGIKTILRGILKTGMNHDVLGDEGHFQELMPAFFAEFIRTCKKNKIKERILCSEKVKKKIQKFEYNLSETKALPHELIIPTTTLITNDKIILFDWIKPYNAVIIKNKHMAQSYQNYFELLWKTAKK